MPLLKPVTPTHLSLFVTNPENGHPVARLPLYAEVAVPRVLPVPPVDEQLREATRAGLIAADPSMDAPTRDRIEAALMQALSQVVDEATRNDLATQPERLVVLVRQTLREALATSHRGRLADIPAAELEPLLVATLRRLGAELGLGLVSEPEDSGAVWAEPLGVLATDHVGYVSFDLRRLSAGVQRMLADAIEARRADPDAVSKLAIWIYPYGSSTRFDALRQGRFAVDAVVARLPIVWNTLPRELINMGPRALQNPSLTDWRLSPASFAASPNTLVGDDGCEQLVPANLALQEFVLRQVVRLSDAPPGLVVPEIYRAAYVDEYKVSWFSLGHSLGEILYSLPLAPGETVKLAVIDWSWDSLSKRDETTKLTEELLHQTHRDRTITETVKAGIRELQHGSSFMGGMASSAGGSASANVSGVGLGAAVGNAWSLGGSTATSNGSRDLAAENVQRLSDSFSQASSSQRELNSTVVIHARQEEKESIQTRTFSNYNHSHTLTILYYEVLRHFRVTVEWVRRRPAILAKLPAAVTFNAATVLEHRWQLEPALLDPTLAAGFAALEKREATREQLVLNGTPNGVPARPGFWEGDLEFELFELGIQSKAGEGTEEVVVAYLITKDTDLSEKKYELRYVYKGSSPIGDPHNINAGARMQSEWGVWTFVKPFNVTTGRFEKVKWGDIMGFQIEKWGDSHHWRIDFLTINGLGANGLFVGLTEGARDVDLWFEKEEPGSHSFTWIKRPVPRAPDVPAVPSAELSMTAEENAQIALLLAHLASASQYNRAIQLSTDPNALSVLFESAPWTGGLMLDDVVEPTPLEVFGSYVGYPLAKRVTAVDDTTVVDIAAALNGSDPGRRQRALDQLAAMSDADRQTVLDRLPLASAKSERLITLPTRGLFAEGKLGHCNVSEVIDNTRFWDWKTSPIPVAAPDIAPVQPVTPTPQQVAGTTPTAFPTSLLNIVNPTAAPDPTGLAAALGVLATPNIFRDMSGRAEVADLLKKLSDNTIGIAEAANRARDIQQKYGSAPAAAGGAGSAGGGARALPNQPSSANRDLHDLQNVLGRAQDAGLMTPQQAKQAYANAVGQATGSTPESDPLAAAELPQGEFVAFVQAGRLNARVAETLASFMAAPLDSWRRMIARFAQKQLDANILVGIVADSETAGLRSKFLSIAADPQPDGTTANAFFQDLATLTPAFGRNVPFLNRSGTRSSLILVGQDVLAGTAFDHRNNNTRFPVSLADLLVHELTHVRNQDAQQMLRLIPDSAATVYVDPALAAARTAANTAANPPGFATVQVLRSFVEEMCARHVVWRVRNELLGKTGTLVVQADQLGLATREYFIERPGVFSLNNGYVEQINVRGTVAQLQQIGLWLNMCQFYSFSEVGTQDADAKQLFRLAGVWATAEAARATPLQDLAQPEGLTPLLRDFV